MTEEFDMDIEVLSVTELNNVLRVKVRHCYGEDDFGLSIKSKTIDPFTDKPRWLGNVYKLLEKKYDPKTKAPIEVINEYTGQVISLKDMKQGKVSGFKKRLLTSLNFTQKEADSIIEKYEPIQLRLDVMNEKILPFSKAINDKLITYYGGTGLGFDSDNRPEIVQLKKEGKLDKLGKPTDKINKKQVGAKK